VHQDKALPAADCPDPVVISGSWNMVTDRLDWSENLAAWIRERYQTQMPLLGICYGHQLMAHALGGRVDYAPKGAEVGYLPVQLSEQAQHHELLADLPMQFPALLTHQQSVLSLPDHVEVLGRSAQDPHQILRYGPSQWSVQFHPEFFAGLLRYCVLRKADFWRAQGIDPQALADPIQDTPDAHRLLCHFVRTYSSSGPKGRRKNSPGV
ncbi:glutamine amidotransferase, partial [Providencia rettgeri]|nr:glutamine amidotransferase [Providencia rettgeri]